MVELLLAWLAQYGYPVIFLAATLENVFPIGFLVPGEIVVLSAAVASDAASLDPMIIALLAAAGETLGEMLSYLLGRVAGTPFLEWIARRFPRTADPLERAGAYFRQRGAWAIILGRPAWGIKATLPVIAGASGMPAPKAVLLVTVSSLYYYPALVALAYGLGLGFGELANATRWASAIAAVLVTVAAVILWRRHHRHHA